MVATSGRTWVEVYARSAVTTWAKVDPQRAFDYVSDIARHPEWTVNEVVVRPGQPGPVRLGSRFTSSGRQGGRDWPSELEVTIFEPPVRFEFTATGGPGGTRPGHPHRHEFLLTAEDGGTRIELRRADPIPNVLLGLVAPMIVRVTLGIRLRTLGNLRSRLEKLSVN